MQSISTRNQILNFDEVLIFRKKIEDAGGLEKILYYNDGYIKSFFAR